MLTSKQRAKLRAAANTMETILQVGKGGIGDALIRQVEEALVARELIKLCALETAPDTARDTAAQIAERVNAEVVQVIGTRFVLFRRNPKKPLYERD